MVASATQSLVEAANALVVGEGEEENFIAAAKQVSVSTGHIYLNKYNKLNNYID